MEDFFGKALGVVSGNDGVMPIVIMFVFASIVTLIVSKTVKLNQKQSYAMLSMVFVGMMVFLIVLYAIFLSPQKTVVDKNETKNETIVENNKNLDANVSNYNNGGSNKNIINGNTNTTLNIENN